MARIGKNQQVVNRGEIWTTNLLEGGVGFEISKKRPGLVISSNNINSKSPIVIIIPISSQISQVIGPERVLLPKKEAGLEKDSMLLVYQLRAIDKTRLGKKVGKISKEKIKEVEEALRLVLSLDEDT